MKMYEQNRKVEYTSKDVGNIGKALVQTGIGEWQK